MHISCAFHIKTCICHYLNNISSKWRSESLNGILLLLLYIEAFLLIFAFLFFWCAIRLMSAGKFAVEHVGSQTENWSCLLYSLVINCVFFTVTQNLKIIGYYSLPDITRYYSLAYRHCWYSCCDIFLYWLSHILCGDFSLHFTTPPHFFSPHKTIETSTKNKQRNK